MEQTNETIEVLMARSEFDKITDKNVLGGLNNRLNDVLTYLRELLGRDPSIAEITTHMKHVGLHTTINTAGVCAAISESGMVAADMRSAFEIAKTGLVADSAFSAAIVVKYYEFKLKKERGNVH
jgi:hypothetical protein